MNKAKATWRSNAGNTTYSPEHGTVPGARIKAIKGHTACSPDGQLSPKPLLEALLPYESCSQLNTSKDTGNPRVNRARPGDAIQLHGADGTSPAGLSASEHWFY